MFSAIARLARTATTLAVRGVLLLIIIEGTASREVINEAMRRHYAEDAGKSKEECESIKGDETKLSFLADGVLIKM